MEVKKEEDAVGKAYKAHFKKKFTDFEEDETVKDTMRSLTFALAILYEKDRCKKPHNQVLDSLKEEFFGMEPVEVTKNRLRKENEMLRQ